MARLFASVFGYMQSLQGMAVLAFLILVKTVSPSAVQAIPIDGMTTGGSEKGGYLGLDSQLGRQGLLEVGILYLDAMSPPLDIGFSKPIKIDIEGGGVRIAYSRFLLKSSEQSGPFIQAALTAANLGASTSLDLDALEFTTGSNTVITCSSCGTLRLHLNQPLVSVIPSVGFGWQARIGSHVRLRGMVGLQYYDVPQVEWSASGVLPRSAVNEINDAVDSLNNSIYSQGTIFPTGMISVTYAF